MSRYNHLCLPVLLYNRSQNLLLLSEMLGHLISNPLFLPHPKPLSSSFQDPANSAYEGHRVLFGFEPDLLPVSGFLPDWLPLQTPNSVPVCMPFTQLLSVDTSYFHTLATVKNAALNAGVEASLHRIDFITCGRAQVGLQGHVVVPHWRFLL